MVKLIIDTEEKYRRNNNKRNPRNEKGLTPKQQELADLKVKVLELKEQRLKNKEIAKRLEISIKSLERYITELKKEGSL